MKYLVNFLIIFLLTETRLYAQNSSNSTTVSTQNNTNVTVIPTNTTAAATTVATTLSTAAAATTASTTTANLCSTNSSFCNYNGNCTFDSTANQQKCTCNTNYDGDKCELKACTNENQCLNDGACFQNILTNDYTCKCKPDYTGALCERPKCIGYCYNDGICEFDEKTDTRKCTCLERFHGKFCEFDYCQKEAATCAKKCYLYRDDSKCKCACDDECNNAFCNAKGVCDLSGDKLVCKCNVGYSGPQCNTDDCRNYCFNNGTCDRNQSTEVTCRCAQGFTGKRCEAKYVPPKERRSTAARVFTYLLVLVLLVASITLAFYVYKRGGFEYIREKFDNLSYRLRSSYEIAPHGRSNIPYQPQNKPDDSYTDPFS